MDIFELIIILGIAAAIIFIALWLFKNIIKLGMLLIVLAVAITAYNYHKTGKLLPKSLSNKVDNMVDSTKSQVTSKTDRLKKDVTKKVATEVTEHVDKLLKLK